MTMQTGIKGKTLCQDFIILKFVYSKKCSIV